MKWGKKVDIKKLKEINIKTLKYSKYIYPVAALVLATSLVFLGYVPKQNASAFDADDGLIVQGSIEAKDVSINSKIPGKILKIYVEEGASVKAGDIIVEISSDEIKAKKEQAVAVVAAAQASYEAAKEQVNAAKSTLDKAENGPRSQEMSQAQSAYDLAIKTLSRVDELYNNKKEQTLSIIEAAGSAYEGAKAQTAAAKAVQAKAEKGARDQEIAQAQAQYDLFVKTYERVTKLYEKGAISAQKVDEIKAQLDVVTQTLSMAKEGARVEDKSAAEATVSQAQAGEEARKAQYEQAQSAIDEVEYTFGLKRDEAQAQVDIRKQMLDMAKEGARTEDKSGAQAVYGQALAMEDAAKGKLDQAQGALNEVEVYLKDTKILSPMDGTITSLNCDEGELISTGMSIATVSNIAEPWLEVKVKETDLDKVSLGQSVDVKIPCYEKKAFSGKVTTINKKADFATKRATNDNGEFDIISFGVKIEFDKEDEILHPGMTAFVQFKIVR